MFVYVIQYNCWLYLILGIFPILILYCHYIRIWINMFVNIISMFTAICWCTSYYLVEVCHTYFLYMICCAIFTILIELHSKNCINTSFFELVFTCIETPIFVPSFSISHVFISIINFYVFLLLGNIFTLNIQHSNTCNQHHLYTIFEKYPVFNASSLDTSGSTE